MDYIAKKKLVEEELDKLNKVGQNLQKQLQQVATRIEQVKGQLQLIAEIQKEEIKQE